MKLTEAIEAARQHTNTPLVTRLDSKGIAELNDLAKMYAAGELRGVSWHKLAEQMRPRWRQNRLQGETLKRNVRRLADELGKSGGRGRQTDSP
tara:strand:+ start:808 stop:1086 length:279 start_codon:yes stop_codon:yes gene_type:complete